MNKLMDGRKLVNALGIPGWLFLIWKGEIFYAIFILVVVVLGLGEFYNLTMKKGARPLRWVGMVSSVFIIDYYYVQPSLTSHQIFGCILLVIIITLIWELFSNKEEPIINILSTIAGIMIVPILLGTSVDLRQFDSLMNTNITLTLVISIWTCDSAAFVFGSFFGTKKIFPRVSPNKSWIGSISGFVGSIIIYFSFYKLGYLGDIFSGLDSIILGIIAGLFGQIGDFSESLFKRDAGVKDSGKILKGHGGILDRFDSLIFATPITYLYIHFFMNP
ncbi:MAG: phosphatidate cytidylyltransferase [Candidatus Neomarinimicrobiota bacterium]|tara:strand:- start:365 stop:1189 length:825 start_codon:yes stop_codon:yes gene_type:complete